MGSWRSSSLAEAVPFLSPPQLGGLISPHRKQIPGLRCLSLASAEIRMTPDEREKMAILRERIAKEQDRGAFEKLVKELNDPLSRKKQRLKSKP
jgi:hypothetical protein